MDEIVQFDFPTDSPKIIKVIGVGGGGGNAVNHMYRDGCRFITETVVKNGGKHGKGSCRSQLGRRRKRKDHRYAGRESG